MGIALFSTDPRELADYTTGLFAREDAVLRELRQEIQRRAMPEIYVSAEEGQLLHVLLAASGARRVLEIGTLGGYSTIWMARALPPGGELVTLEIEPAHAELAREFIARAGFDERVEVRVGMANETLGEIAAESREPFDAFFIDADKVSYPAYLQWARRLVRPGGLILADNAFMDGDVLDSTHPDEGTLAMQQFNRRLAADDSLRSTIIPVRDGLAVAVVGEES